MLNTTVWRLAATPMNGDADLWCWIPKHERWARFGAVYIYVYPSMLFISYVFIQVCIYNNTSYIYMYHIYEPIGVCSPPGLL